MNSTLDDRLSLAFTDLPVEEGLRQLIAGHHFVFLYTPTGKLEEVRIYAASRPARRPSSERPSMEIAAEAEFALQATINDPEPERRIEAALALSATKKADAALNILLELLQPSYEPAARQKALAALTGFKAVPVEPIAEVVLFDPEPSIGFEAVKLLELQVEQDPVALTAIRQVAEGAQDERIREEAQALLRSIESTSDQ